MNPKESENAVLVFQGFDSNSDGKISKTELNTALTSLGVSGSKGDLEELFLSLDMDHNGFLDLGEFMELFYMMNRKQGS